MGMIKDKILISVSINDSLSKAIELMMKNNISHIPVKYYKEMKGIVSKTTITDYVASLLAVNSDMTLKEAFDKTSVSKIMSAPVITTDNDNFSVEIIQKLVSERVGSVLIYKDDQPVGLVTKTDILYAFKDYLEKNRKIVYFSNYVKNWLFEKGIVHYAMKLGDVGI